MPGFVGARQSGRHKGAHQKARAAAFKLLPEWSLCVRCHRSMWKWEQDKLGRSALHYDHNDSNTGYLGFSHARCNVRDGARKGGLAQHAAMRGERQCRQCGQLFKMKHPDQTRCSYACRAAEQRAQERACKDCGAALPQPVGKRLRCLSCAPRAARKQSQDWSYKRYGNHKHSSSRPVGVAGTGQLALGGTPGPGW